MVTLDDGGARRGTAMVISPPASLASWVESFSCDEWTPESPRRRAFRVVADDAPHVLWHVGWDGSWNTSRVAIVGARSRHHDANPSGRRFSIAARLKPGALPLIAGIPAHRLTNHSMPLDEARDQTPARWLRGVRPTSSAGAFDVFSGALERAFTARPPLDDRAAWIASLDRTSAIRVSEIASTLGMSVRTLHAWSVGAFGMSIRQLLRIRRLHAALELGLSRGPWTWSRVASEAGYADQSHLNRDCRALLGETPGEFARRAG